ncbi:alpha/beta hydrolase [Paenibacillus thailandensis]|uniref:Alpha/beta hydrolase n=1 Tax=Paenibacillus thailandensis TaxID=393250 RepID=A0ABW5QYP7_9BACL
MALFQCDFYSDTLRVSASMNVVLPQKKEAIGLTGRAWEDKYPVLYLLHGLSDDHTTWIRKTSIERYATDKGVAVVMPDVGRSFYADMKRGYSYWTFVTEELPQLARSFFPLSDRREDNFVAGLSMGGYGAFKIGLSQPDKYAAAASLSGALDIASKEDDPWGLFLPLEAENIFGSAQEVRGGENDLFHLAERLARYEGPKTKLFQCCGTEDFLYEDNRRFLAHATKLGLDVTYEEEPGTHEWGYWDAKIQRVLDWLPLDRE